MPSFAENNMIIEIKLLMIHRDIVIWNSFNIHSVIFINIYIYIYIYIYIHIYIYIVYVTLLSLHLSAELVEQNI